MRMTIFHLTLLFLAVSGVSPLLLSTSLPEACWGQDGQRQQQDLFLSSAGGVLCPDSTRRKAWLWQEEEEEETQDPHKSYYSSSYYHQFPFVDQTTTSTPPDLDGCVRNNDECNPEQQKTKTTTLQDLQEAISRLFFLEAHGLQEAGFLCEPQAAKPPSSLQLPHCSHSIALLDGSADNGHVEWSSTLLPREDDLLIMKPQMPLQSDLGTRRQTNPAATTEESRQPPCVVLGIDSEFLLPRTDGIDMMPTCLYDSDDDDYGRHHSEESSLMTDDGYVPFMAHPTLFPYHIPSGFSLAGRDTSTSAGSSIMTESSEMDLDDGFDISWPG